MVEKHRCILIYQVVCVMHLEECIEHTLLQTNTPEAWFHGDRREGKRDGCSFSWPQRRMSRTCRGTWTCRTARPCSAPWGPLSRGSSRWVGRSNCSHQWRKIYKVPQNKCLSHQLNIVILPALGEAPEAEHGLEQVVGYDDVLDVIRLPVLHEPARKKRCHQSRLISKLELMMRKCWAKWPQFLHRINFILTTAPQPCRWRRRECRLSRWAKPRTSWSNCPSWKIGNQIYLGEINHWETYRGSLKSTMRWLYLSYHVSTSAGDVKFIFN